MQYTYKDECFISDKSDVHGIILVLVLVCVDVLLFFAAIGFYILKGRTSLFSTEWITVLLTLGSAWSVHHSIRHRQKPALERRRRRMAEGTRYTGKIVDAGMVMESEQVSDTYEIQDMNDPDYSRDKFRYCYRRVPNYWIYRRMVSGGRASRTLGILRCNADGKKLAALVLGPRPKTERILKILRHYQFSWREKELEYV